MNIDLSLLAVAGAAALGFNFFLPIKGRTWFILGLSIISLFWLQPPLPLRWSGFFLPLLLISLVAISWWATRPAAAATFDRQTWVTLLFISILIVILGGVRYLPVGWRPTLNRPPGVEIIAVVWAGFLLVWWLLRNRLNSVYSLLALSGIILFLFILLKTPPSAAFLSSLWRTASGQNPELAAAADISWLGYSYIAFRLLHTLRDRFTGQLPDLSLQSYMGYVLFFPALLAGPIDRAERFKADWQSIPAVVGLDGQRWRRGLHRIANGLFKKFVIADSLALGLSLNPAVAEQANSTLWLWVLLYGYGLRLYFDFSGYTDIAIGMGLLFGVELPENFDRPYWQPSITAFWQSWHITLSSWVRFYVFTPLSRALLRRKPRPTPTLILLSSQLATMIIIGLWHGITINFLIWGVWHGLGLFVHKKWSDRTRRWYRELSRQPRQLWLWTWIGRLLTLNFVMIGWVWFLMPEFNQALDLFGKLLGAN